MTDEIAIKILKIIHDYAESYKRTADSDAGANGNDCAVAVSNSAWHILRGFGYEHEDIKRLYREATKQ